MYQPAAANADQFKQSFREEAREILVDLEAALLELNENRADMELVGRVFRALHTIKGSGAMFGFEELAAFTHNLETAFDQVRNGRLEISSELIDLTLAALDQIRAMLEEGAGAPPADPAACAEILAKVRQLAGIPESHGLRTAKRDAAAARPRLRWRSGARVAHSLCSRPGFDAERHQSAAAAARAAVSWEGSR